VRARSDERGVAIKPVKYLMRNYDITVNELTGRRGLRVRPVDAIHLRLYSGEECCNETDAADLLYRRSAKVLSVSLRTFRKLPAMDDRVE